MDTSANGIGDCIIDVGVMNITYGVINVLYFAVYDVVENVVAWLSLYLLLDVCLCILNPRPGGDSDVTTFLVNLLAISH